MGTRLLASTAAATRACAAAAPTKALIRDPRPLQMPTVNRVKDGFQESCTEFQLNWSDSHSCGRGHCCLLYALHGMCLSTHGPKSSMRALYVPRNPAPKLLAEIMPKSIDAVRVLVVLMKYIMACSQSREVKSRKEFYSSSSSSSVPRMWLAQYHR